MHNARNLLPALLMACALAPMASATHGGNPTAAQCADAAWLAANPAHEAECKINKGTNEVIRMVQYVVGGLLAIGLIVSIVAFGFSGGNERARSNAVKGIWGCGIAVVLVALGPFLVKSLQGLF